MPITPDSPWRHPPRITLAGFERVLRRGNPGILAERPASAYYNWCVNKGVDPLYLLAKINHESSLGTAGVAVTTHSWGNTRKPNFGATPISEVAGRTGTFPVWRDWLDGLKSTVERLVTPEWIYSERESIREIYDWPPDQTKVWAPAGDLNDPRGYLRAVIDFMNANEDVMAAQIPGFAWVPETAGEYGYPQGTHGRNGVAIDRLIIHCTIGTDSLGHLTGGNGNSVHLLDNRDGTPRAQMVLLEDAAWGAGNRAYNLRGVNYEHECTGAEMRNPAYWTDAIIGNMAKNCAAILRLCPNILPDREHVIGHGEVPDQDHTDPGPAFPWDRFMAALVGELNGADDALYLTYPDGTRCPYPIVLGFRSWCIGQGNERNPLDLNAGILSVTGYPIEPEWRGKDGCSYQRFERMALQYQPGVASPFDIVPVLCGTALPPEAA